MKVVLIERPKFISFFLRKFYNIKKENQSAESWFTKTSTMSGFSWILPFLLLKTPFCFDTRFLYEMKNIRIMKKFFNRNKIKT